MLAELYLRVAADPNAVGSLTAAELGELLAEPVPPLWVFTEAARRRHDATVLARLFSHPKAPRDLLRQAVGSDAKRLERFEHHVNVYTGPPPPLGPCLSWVVPERALAQLSPAQEQLLAQQLAPHCLQALRPSLRCERAKATLDERGAIPAGDFYKLAPEARIAPRYTEPFARFVLLGDFLSYLTCSVQEPIDNLPVLAKVALALGEQRSWEQYLNDADVRVRAAAEERKSWSES